MASLGGAPALDAALVGPVCGHETPQTIMLVKEGRPYCGRCWRVVETITHDWDAGVITAAEVRDRLTAVLESFEPRPSVATVHAEVDAWMHELGAPRVREMAGAS